MAKRKLAHRKTAAAKKKAEEESKVENHQQEEKLLDEGDDKREKELKKEEQEKPKIAQKRYRKRLKPETEPEYFEDKRNLEDLWKEVFPVGTEWDQLHLVYQYNWNFTNLENAFEERGELYGKRVYLFGCTEPQMVPLKDVMKITHVPVVVAVVSPFPPSDKIGINSVQREAEEIVPMKRMKMDWVPYIPLENRGSMVEKLKSEIFILGCSQRRTALRHLKEDRVKKFEYCLPYFYDPMKEDELEQSTVVTIMYEIQPQQDKKQEQQGEENQEQAQQQQQEQSPPIVCDFDWEFDELEEFTDKLINEDEVLPPNQKEAFKDFVKSKVREAKKANREAREARKKAVEEMSAEKKAALESMKFYKYYPVATSDTPDVSGVKSPFINRYYGKAHKVF